MNERGGAPPGGGRRTRARARRRDARAPPRRAAAARPRARASSECERYRVEVSRRARSLRSLPPSETCVSRAPRENKLRVGARRRVPGVSRSHFDRSIPTPESIEPPDRSTGAASVNGPDRIDVIYLKGGGGVMNARQRGVVTRQKRRSPRAPPFFPFRLARRVHGRRTARDCGAVVCPQHAPRSRGFRSAAARRTPPARAASPVVPRPEATSLARALGASSASALSPPGASSASAAPARVARGAALVHPPRQTSVARVF